MSKVFSAKRNEIAITYEFIDGTSSELSVVALSTKEGKEVGSILKDETTTMADFFEKLVPLHLQKNDLEIVKKVVSEQMNEGNIIDFGKALGEVLEEAKTEKGNA